MTVRKFIVVDLTHTLISKRQHDVLRLANEGKCSKTTAKELGIGVESVKEHRQRIFRKLGVHSIGRACAVAREAGLV